MILNGIYILDDDSVDKIYAPEERAGIASLVNIIAPPFGAGQVEQNLDALGRADVIFSGWSAPLMDQSFLDAAPRLKVVFYGAGSVKYFVTDAFWERGVAVTSAYAANAVPVAEYALSQILFCLKLGWQYATAVKQARGSVPRIPAPGGYKSTVGIISLGMIGRLVCRLLKNFDIHVLAYDPFAGGHAAAELGVELCPIDDVFRRADVVSLHAPWLKETENMIAGRHFDSMKPYASFINTSRGAVVNEAEMIAALARRPDLFAVLDVTQEEPPEPGSPLYTLPNVSLTPHIAGSMDNECRRMGRYMVEELQRYLAGEPLKWSISREQAGNMA